METRIIEKIFLNGNEISIIDEKIRTGFDKREWKVIIFTEYNGDKIVIRNEINVILKNQKTVVNAKNQKVILKCSSKTILGQGVFRGINSDGYAVITDLKIYIKDDENKNNPKFIYTNNPKKLFRLFSDRELIARNLSYDTYKNDKEIVDIYIKGLFKIYYTMLKYSVTNLSKNIENKYSALCAYLAIRDCFKKYGIVMSYPNCFIKGYKLEYDALILKSEKLKYVNNNYDVERYFYNQEDILATMEIKVCGIFYNYSSIDNDFKNYLMEQHGIAVPNKKNKIYEYNYNNKLSVPHIYITLHEGSTKNTEKKFYEKCANVIKNMGDEYIGIFCSTKVGNEQFVIPVDYDLNKILENNILK